MNRRGFLGFLGVGAAASPLAAKAAADELTAAVTTGLAPAGPSIAAAGETLYGSHPPLSMDQLGDTYLKMSHYLKFVGALPEHVDETLRQESKHLYGFDADIAVKKSWSFAVKVQEQRERNYRRAVERMHKLGPRELKHRAFKKLTGFDWSW